MSALDKLVAWKGVFEAGAEREVAKLLALLSGERLRQPEQIIQLHETTLFFRAYAHSPRVQRLADKILFDFAPRLKGVNPAPFEAAEVSGIAGSAIATNFSREFARFLARRHGRNITVDWENYPHADRMGPVLARLAPVAAEDWTVEPHIDWQRWFRALRGDVRWLADNLDTATYDSLELMLLWQIDNKASRSHARLPRRDIFYHKAPLLKRRDVAIHQELAGPRIPVRRMKPAEARRVLDITITTSAVRYRELWGFSYPDLQHVYHADLGRGVDLYWLGIPPHARLPLRAYHAGIFFKNGVPLGYVETLSFFDRMEVGFNVYYTFRDGESAWLYARFLKFCSQQCGVTCFSIDPYQLGHENGEAIDSGALWFYRKLGFCSASAEIQRLMEREEGKLANRADYRTAPAALRRMARAPMLYGSTLHDWKRFSLRTLAQKAGRGEAWPGILKQVKSEIAASDILKAKNAPQETQYLRLLQNSPQLRRSVLRAGRVAES